MKPRFATWMSVVLTFVVAAIFYMFAYSWMTKKQTGRGPWQVLFTTNSAGVPELVIAQPALGLSNITVRFEDERLDATNGTGPVSFGKPRTPAPFGRVVYDDLMFLPGSVAVDCFGHVVEMIPRHLILNGSPHPWQSGDSFSLFATNRVSPEVRKQWKGGYN